ncbi:hypothetical protein F2P56_020941 [Juglans regia]|uniref:F-box protein At4g22030 n=2 Tax=Juglans regia TaxID=51240 RepID=A0A833X5V3_JUGRE|nr:probable F-box protein At4g22030 [Juglans regia]KAF5461122.1 hypothetical protein F2P56_020941 [Juglans regia]
MATLQAASFCSSSSSSSSRKIKATLNASKIQSSDHLSFPRVIFDELNRRNGLQTFQPTSTHTEMNPNIGSANIRNGEAISSSKAMQELYTIMGIVADRTEMHKNIGAQRDNWNRLLLNSVNGMTLTGATMAGLASVSGAGAPILALKLSASVLFLAATGILLVMNKIQPSQLAEEQRNASRLFKQLHEEIKITLALQNFTANDVKDVTEKVLALDKAYPLPLLGAMLDKFPANVEPAVWWPHHLKSQPESGRRVERNGWNENLEKEMRGVLGVLKRKDGAEYVKLSKVVLKVNKVLAVCGPLFTGLAAVGSLCVGLPFCGSWAAVFGAMATVVNSMEHGGQVGMVFEMYRDSAGFFSLMEESIASNLMEREADKRENGELFELKTALLLGRSLSELRDLANCRSTTSSNLSSTSRDEEEFASKLF